MNKYFCVSLNNLFRYPSDCKYARCLNVMFVIKQKAFALGKESAPSTEENIFFLRIYVFLSLRCGWNFIIYFVCFASEFVFFLSIFCSLFFSVLSWCLNIAYSSIIMNHMCSYLMMYTLRIAKPFFFFIFLLEPWWYDVCVNGKKSSVDIMLICLRKKNYETDCFFLTNWKSSYWCVHYFRFYCCFFGCEICTHAI